MSVLIKKPDIPNDISFFNIDDTNYKIGEAITKIDLNGIVYPINSGVNTDDATATELDLLFGKTAYAKGVKITGNIPINGTFAYDIPMYSSDPINIPKGYYNEDIIVTPKYVNGTTVSDFSATGVFGTIVGISTPNSSSQSSTGATVVVTSTTDGNNWASRCAGICFNNKISGTYKHIDVTYSVSGGGRGGVSILPSIPSQASNPQVWYDDNGTVTQKLSIPSGGGYLYLGTYSTNMGYYNTITKTITVKKCILYTS